MPTILMLAESDRLRMLRCCSCGCRCLTRRGAGVRLLKVAFRSFASCDASSAIRGHVEQRTLHVRLLAVEELLTGAPFHTLCPTLGLPSAIDGIAEDARALSAVERAELAGVVECWAVPGGLRLYAWTHVPLFRVCASTCTVLLAGSTFVREAAI
jgi:hypothetical protein